METALTEPDPQNAKFTCFWASSGQRIAKRFQFRTESVGAESKNRVSRRNPDITANLCLWMFANLISRI
jgi:hypothetical protein